MYQDGHVIMLKKQIAQRLNNVEQKQEVEVMQPPI